MKQSVYARESVPHLWFINPTTCTLEVFRLESDRWILLGTHRDDEIVRAEPFDAVPLDLARLWDRPAAPRRAPIA